MSVILDVQALQNPGSAERGIGRYVGELACALDRREPSVVSRYLLNPDLPVPEAVEQLAGSGRLTFSDRPGAAQGAAHHISSPFEPAGIDRVWPFALRRLRLVVTVHDLIPDIFSAEYLKDPRARRAYGARIELVRRADLILAVSEATARDVIERLEVPAERVVITGEGVSERFCPPASRASATAAVRKALPWAEPGLLLYTAGALEYRKNVDGLLEAYAGLPDALRARHQLVVVCRIQEEERMPLERRVQALGIADRVFFPGYVTDDELVLLYQAAELFVCPSLYEGFGLPVAEAMACGTPVIAGRNSSLVELVRDEAALFDAGRPAAIREAIERCLSDRALLERLREARLDECYTWLGVAERTAAAYDVLLEKPARSERRRRRIAVVAPPGVESVQKVSERHPLLTGLVAHCDIDLFLRGRRDAEAPAGITVVPLEHFERLERTRGGYDRVVYPLADGQDPDASKLLRRRTGVVLARGGRLDRQTIAGAERVLVPSARAADLARLAAAPADEAKIEVTPLADGGGNGRGDLSPDRAAELAYRVLVLGRSWADAVAESSRPPTIELDTAVSLAAYLERPLVVADVGCRWGVAEVWSSFRPYVSVIGFDPDVAECERLAVRYRGDPSVRFIPLALGPNRRSARLYVTEDPGSSSLYEPDPELIRRRPELWCTRPVTEAQIEMISLDEWIAGDGIAIDVIKLDTQGSELGVLEGAGRSLGSVRALEVEVEFNEMYRGQPLFGDVDRYLRERGFVLWRLKHLVHYGLADAPSELELDEQQVFDSRPVPFRAQGGQLYWGHAYYVRRELALGPHTDDWEQSLRDALIVCAMGFPDLARSAFVRAAASAPIDVRLAIEALLEA